MLEGIEDLFEGEGLVGAAVGDLPHVSVGSGTHLLEQRVPRQHMGFYFFSHFLQIDILNYVSISIEPT